MVLLSLMEQVPAESDNGAKKFVNFPLKRLAKY
jgi:hypothetical protein